jgi:hypothetical protein
LIRGCPGKRERFAFPPLGLAKTCGTERGTPGRRNTRRKSMLEKLIDEIILELKTTDLQMLFVEDPYRLQTVIDDHMRRMEDFEIKARKLVNELEGA